MLSLLTHANNIRKQLLYQTSRFLLHMKKNPSNVTKGQDCDQKYNHVL